MKRNFPGEGTVRKIFQAKRPARPKAPGWQHVGEGLQMNEKYGKRELRGCGLVKNKIEELGRSQSFKPCRPY